MKSDVKYIVDESGEKTSVVVPLKEWNRIHQDHDKLMKKIEILTGIKTSMIEIRKARKSGNQLQSLQSLVHELRSKG